MPSSGLGRHCTHARVPKKVVEHSFGKLYVAILSNVFFEVIHTRHSHITDGKAECLGADPVTHCSKSSDLTLPL